MFCLRLVVLLYYYFHILLFLSQLVYSVTSWLSRRRCGSLDYTSAYCCQKDCRLEVSDYVFHNIYDGSVDNTFQMQISCSIQPHTVYSRMDLPLNDCLQWRSWGRRLPLTSLWMQICAVKLTLSGLLWPKKCFLTGAFFTLHFAWGVRSWSEYWEQNSFNA